MEPKDVTLIEVLSWPQRFGALILAIIFGSEFLGLQKKSMTAWKAGFVIFIVGCIDSIWQVTATMHETAPVIDFQSFWFPIVIWTIVGASVTLYWCIWWNKKRYYFLS
jgi:hypothetical protein